MRRLLTIALAVARASARHEVPGRAAQMAFYLLLAIFPAGLALVGVLSLANIEGALPNLQALTERGLPPAAAALILQEVNSLGGRTGWPLLLAIVFSIYYGGRGLGSAVRGVELAFSGRYSTVTVARSGLLGFGLTGILLLVVQPLLLTLLTVLSSAVRWAHGAGVFIGATAELLTQLRWPLLCLIFQQFALAVYRLGARGEIGRRLLTHGSAFAAIAWAIVTVGFEWYLETFSDLGATYGSLGAVVGLLLYAHVVSTVLLLGAELDNVMTESARS